jgi:hypothetical protein
MRINESSSGKDSKRAARNVLSKAGLFGYLTFVIAL